MAAVLSNPGTDGGAGLRIKKRWILLPAVALLVFVFIRSLGKPPSIADNSYLLVDVRGAYAEGGPPGLLTRLLEDRKRFEDLLSNLEKAARDKRIDGVVVKIGALATGWGQASEIRDALAEVRAADKKVIAFLNGESFGGNQEYYLASAADEIYMPPAASSLLNGLSAHYLFLGGFWEKVDIAMEVQQIGEYKTFGDMISRRQMSKAHHDMANSLLDDVNLEFLSTLAQTRGLTIPELEEIIESGPFSPEAFVEAGLADGVKFLDQLRDDLGADKPAVFVTEREYQRIPRESLGLGGGDKVAIIHAAGVLVTGKSRRSSGMGETVGSHTLSEALQAAAQDTSVKAIVLRIDSPGGSPHAADEVWYAVRRTRTDKPVIASMGNVAASGGYYIAAAAAEIMVDPMTLTGSIGVVMYKPNIAGLLGRLGIGNESLSRGKFSRLMDITKGLNRAETALLSDQMEAIYRLFTQRVSEGRNMETQAVDSLGKGRVWTGTQAVENGLADQTGGLRAAVRRAASKAGVADLDRVETVYFPKPGGLTDQLMDAGAVKAQAIVPKAWQSIIEAAPFLELQPGVYTLVAPSPVIR